jgi:hypothetical protein
MIQCFTALSCRRHLTGFQGCPRVTLAMFKYCVVQEYWLPTSLISSDADTVLPSLPQQLCCSHVAMFRRPCSGQATSAVAMEGIYIIQGIDNVVA